LAEVAAEYRIDARRSISWVTRWRVRQPGGWPWSIRICSQPGPIAGGGDPKDEVKLRHIPQFIVHGANDQTVPVAHRGDGKAARQAGAAVVYVEVPAQGTTTRRSDSSARCWISSPAGEAGAVGLRDNDYMTQAIIRDPEIMHGTPVFAGTRVPVQTLFDYLEGGETLEDFLTGFRRFRATRLSGHWRKRSNSYLRASDATLIDECIDERLRHLFPDHDCQTARHVKLAGLKNGDLLSPPKPPGSR